MLPITRFRAGISRAGPTSGAAAQTAFSFNFAVQNGKADISHPAGDERSSDAMHRNGSAGRHEVPTAGLGTLGGLIYKAAFSNLSATCRSRLLRRTLHWRSV